MCEFLVQSSFCFRDCSGFVQLQYSKIANSQYKKSLCFGKCLRFRLCSETAWCEHAEVIKREAPWVVFQQWTPITLLGRCWSATRAGKLCLKRLKWFKLHSLEVCDLFFFLWIFFSLLFTLLWFPLSTRLHRMNNDVLVMTLAEEQFGYPMHVKAAHCCQARSVSQESILLFQLAFCPWIILPFLFPPPLWRTMYMG